MIVDVATTISDCFISVVAHLRTCLDGCNADTVLVLSRWWVHSGDAERPQPGIRNKTFQCVFYVPASPLYIIFNEGKIQQRGTNAIIVSAGWWIHDGDSHR